MERPRTHLSDSRDAGPRIPAGRNRRRWFLGLASTGIAAAVLALALQGEDARAEKTAQEDSAMSESTPDVSPPPTVQLQPDFGPVEKTEAEWRQILSEEEFYILRKEGTERPFTSELNEEKRTGTFVCAACGLPLFRSTAKYDSGTGWPSFFDPIDGALGTKRDYKLLVPRTEYHCARCGGHQGHVFKDGPPPTGLRYCNNGDALDFVPDGEELPELLP